jgi:hypothetical protein
MCYDDTPDAVRAIGVPTARRRMSGAELAAVEPRPRARRHRAMECARVVRHEDDRGMTMLGPSRR